MKNCCSSFMYACGTLAAGTYHSFFLFFLFYPEIINGPCSPIILLKRKPCGATSV